MKEKTDAFKTHRLPAWMIFALALALAGAALAAEADIPVVDGHLGSCATTFTVRDRDNKPIYNARISVLVRYGALSLHKMSLEVGTDSEGRARVAGLPKKTKKPLEFKITSGQLSKQLTVDPSINCKDSVEVNLE